MGWGTSCALGEMAQAPLTGEHHSPRGSPHLCLRSCWCWLRICLAISEPCEGRVTRVPSSWGPCSVPSTWSGNTGNAFCLVDGGEPEGWNKGLWGKRLA